MSDTPTPRTDAVVHNIAELGVFARQLERELAAAQKEIERLRGEIRVAFVEGACAARHWSHLRPDELWHSGINIRAKRIAEGKE